LAVGHELTVDVPDWHEPLEGSWVQPDWSVVMQKTADDPPLDDEELHPLPAPRNPSVAAASPPDIGMTCRIMNRNADFERGEEDMAEGSSQRAADAAAWVSAAAGESL
jgi:hypothetical protein